MSVGNSRPLTTDTVSDSSSVELLMPNHLLTKTSLPPLPPDSYQRGSVGDKEVVEVAVPDKTISEQLAQRILSQHKPMTAVACAAKKHESWGCCDCQGGRFSQRQVETCQSM